MKRLMEYTVFSGLVTAWRLATWPTRRSPVLVMATTDGVVRVPSWLGMTTGSPPCITATTEFVVPKSIPIILLIATFPSFRMRQSLQRSGTNPSVSMVGVPGWKGEGPPNRAKTNAIMHVEWHIVKFFDIDCNTLQYKHLSVALCPKSVQIEAAHELGPEGVQRR